MGLGVMASKKSLHSCVVSAGSPTARSGALVRNSCIKKLRASLEFLKELVVRVYHDLRMPMKERVADASTASMEMLHTLSMNKSVKTPALNQHL